MGIDGIKMSKEGVEETLPPDAFSETKSVFEPEVMSSAAEVAEGLEQKESYLGDKKLRGIMEYATGKVLGMVGGVAEKAFDASVRASVNAWFARREKRIEGRFLSANIYVAESGHPESRNTVMYIPGMFDDGVDARMRSIHTKCDLDKNKDEYWMAIKTLYSARDIPRVRAIIDELEEMLIERLDQGGNVTIMGYSCGGLIGKVLADKLSQIYPGRVGLVVHNAPLDPKGGFFVRYSGIAELQKEIGFKSEHPKGDYPFVILAGKEDRIVPCSECIEQPDGEPIKIKEISGGHRRSCIDDPKAARRVYAAVRAVEKYIPRHGKKEEQEAAEVESRT